MVGPENSGGAGHDAPFLGFGFKHQGTDRVDHHFQKSDVNGAEQHGEDSFCIVIECTTLKRKTNLGLSL